MINGVSSWHKSHEKLNFCFFHLYAQKDMLKTQHQYVHRENWTLKLQCINCWCCQFRAMWQQVPGFPINSNGLPSHQAKKHWINRYWWTNKTGNNVECWCEVIGIGRFDAASCRLPQEHSLFLFLLFLLLYLI